ncbi:HNH endonuclease [Sporolactobacillus shoreae]|uniref:HNH endonuclease n=1 Tax=Sporolactobacillus shoreae TaxID=1465501 RepID=A0A4Z0GHD1_9BACL|nr:HNH endonuclease [Sporolactobacillus shoreae]
MSKHEYSFDTNSFSGTLKGNNITLENIYFENIKYTKRDRAEFNQLRKKFDSSVRSNFAKSIVKNEYLINFLKNSGLSNSDISMLKLGKIPRGYNVHHKFPLDDGGTNNFSNLVLIKNHPYHKILTKYQIAKTGHMQEGDSIELKWPIPKKYIYPFETVRKEE